MSERIDLTPCNIIIIFKSITSTLEQLPMQMGIIKNILHAHELVGGLDVVTPHVLSELLRNRCCPQIVGAADRAENKYCNSYDFCLQILEIFMLNIFVHSTLRPYICHIIFH